MTDSNQKMCIPAATVFGETDAENLGAGKFCRVEHHTVARAILMALEGTSLAQLYGNES